MSGPEDLPGQTSSGLSWVSILGPIFITVTSFTPACAVGSVFQVTSGEKSDYPRHKDIQFENAGCNSQERFQCSVLWAPGQSVEIRCRLCHMMVSGGCEPLLEAS